MSTLKQLVDETTNIKNELISSKVIESQSSKVTNDMLLKVKKLSLKDELKNDIECTIGLKYLTELEEIDISNNDLSDVSWLSSCTKLKKVDISNNRIKNFNQIVDNQDLQYLDASNNEINDISKIKFMQKINYLDLSNNEITDISDVSTSYGLESLFLNNNNLTVFKDRLSGLENLNELEKIGLAFISGLVAGQSLQETEQEVNNNNEKEMKVAVGKIEGEKAEKFIKMMKELGVE